jgi:TRAP-type C4-dicarboxylate transport system permease small subunit
VVNEKMIRLATALIILLCVLSRGIAIPAYLRQLNFLAIDARWDNYFNGASKAMLYVSGIAGCGMILYHVFRAYRQRRRLQSTFGRPGPPAK